jgi:hypothetical protein
MAINLIPQEESVTTQENVLKRSIILGIMVLIFSLLIVGGRYFYESKRLADLELEEEDVKSQEDDLKKYKESLERYKSHPALLILSNHTYHTQFLQKIEECVLPNMSLSSIKIDSANKVSISASLTGKYADAARFIKTLKAKGFINVKVSAITRDDMGLVNFSADFEFVKSLILKQ